MTDKNLSLLNASGFAFQLAIESAVRANPGHSGWSVIAREHPWKTTDDAGYADLILTSGNLYVVVECKRSRDATWIFLMPDAKQMSRSHARIAWIDTKPHRPPLAGWGDIQLDPRSPEADFCVIRGQGENDRPMLERVASQVIAAADGLCSDLVSLHERSAQSKVVIPVIVTNAELVVGEFDPAVVDLARAEVENATFSSVQHVRFRKTLGPSISSSEHEPEELHDLSDGAMRTVFVVNSAAFTGWLGQLHTSAHYDSGPWAIARSRADASRL